MAASAIAATAQTPHKPAAPEMTMTAKPASTATHSTAPALKPPPGVPRAKGLVKIAFSLRYQDTKIGTGPDAEPNKMYKVHYTGWLGVNGRDDDGHKFDSSYDRPGQPLKDKDGKPVLGDDGKPKLGDPQPISFPQGYGRLIPGWDQGFYGMKIGGKRRLFIPWQLAYGAKGRPGPDAAHPGIPPKADLIFDVELVEVTDLPTPPGRPGGMVPGARPMPGGAPHPNMTLPLNQAPATPGAPGTPATPPAGAKPVAPAAPATPPTTPPATNTPAPATPPATPPPAQPK
jgi:peptidylprolyl isomerase